MGGQGEYYKNKYGGGRGRGGRGGGRGRGSSRSSNDPGSGGGGGGGGGTYDDLMRLLRSIDNQQYPRYHDLETTTNPDNNKMTGGWVNTREGFTLFVGRAQSDPFAPPTRCRVVVRAAQAQLSPHLYHQSKIRAMATSDYLLRLLYRECRSMGADTTVRATSNNSSGGRSSGGGDGGGGWSGPKGGDIQVLEPSQHVLEQTGVRVDTCTGDITAQVTINLPARGRTILGQAAATMLGETLTTLIQRSLCCSHPQWRGNAQELKQHVDSVEDQQWLQQQLDAKGFVSFVRNGAILPRVSGVSDAPMDASVAIAFQSPERLETSFDLPTLKRTIRGMAIPKGITLICGGGFHGKSTLLQALQLGVYPKVPGDGREFVVTSPTAMKIRAEDGRSVCSVDISPFINNLPFGKDTTCFSTPDASGSTSQASNIAESIEAGTDALLIDEDTSATNFMIRDSKMVQLVAAKKEPITPFVRLVRPLFDEIGVSSILVIGGSGEFFHVADNVLVMDCYRCLDATDRAKRIASQHINAQDDQQQHIHTPGSFQKIRAGGTRYPVGSRFNADGKTKVISKNMISYGDTEFSLFGLEQLATKSQTNAISAALRAVSKITPHDTMPLEQVLNRLQQSVEQDGLDVLTPGEFNGALARPRRLELAGALNRMRRPNAIAKR